MTTPLRVLIVEDNPQDAELVVRALQRAGFTPDWRRVETEAAFLGSLDAGFDIILSDFAMPQFDGLRALALLQQHGLDVPFILVSGTIGEDAAVEAMKQGAADYLLKDRLARLGRAVTQALAQQRLRAESRAGALALARAEAQYRSIFENSIEGMYHRTPEGRYLTANPAFVRMLGFDTAEELIASGPVVLDRLWVDPDRRERFERLLREKGALTDFEAQIRRKDGTLIWVSANASAVRDDHGAMRYEGTVEEITERKRAEEALRVSEEQFRQAQKMEAIGRLAGGIAHDFNNLLTVISINAEDALAATPETDSRRGNVQSIRDAAERAAALTRQLLVFSRKQVSEPRVFNLNTVVADTERMACRLIGEDIELITTLAPDLGNILADPGQIGHMIMNLLVNARDAMPQGGTLTIATSNAEVRAALPDQGAVPSGAYISLVVSDTGHGMDESTQRQVFEPFFTTKDPAKGTGLGLSTAYGVVRQSGGDIRVSSAPGKGTTFTILLPRETAAVTVTPPAPLPVPASLSGGGETILVTEDEQAVRLAVLRILTAAGYAVLAASNGAEALQLATSRHGPIDLLMTDVVMPLMNGPELAERLTALRPGLKVLFTSGYSESTMVYRGALREAQYLAKPYKVAELKRKVREVLDQVR